MQSRLVCAVAFAVTLAASAAGAQQIALSEPLNGNAPDQAEVMSQLAARTLAVYRDPDRGKYLEGVLQLQMVAGRYADASKTFAELRDLRLKTPGAWSDVHELRWRTYIDARLRSASGGASFDQAFKALVTQALGAMDDHAAYQELFILDTPLRVYENTFRQALNRQAGKTSLSTDDALALVRRYALVASYTAFQPTVATLDAEDDQQRYIIDRDVLVRTPDGASVCAFVYRPRGAPGPLPALLNFTIYVNPNITIDNARLSAAHGYAAVEGFTRGKACSPDQPVPIEHDGADAAALIDWIAAQPWSDGRVGMYGGSYEGFTQWAAAKQFPKALKAIMPSVTFSPGTDFPMEGGVPLTYAYPWPFYTTNNKTLDFDTYFDAARWERMQRTWYADGRAYRDLAKIDGTPNPVFDRWIAHPDFDAYWQGAVPSAKDLGRLGIPVLTTTGYYDSGQIGALSYFRRYARFHPGAEDYLVIGPYDHQLGQIGTIAPIGTSTTSALRGYVLDANAQIDIPGLRYQWFDYIFKGAPKPAVLGDKVNYEVMGANVWKHAPSLAAMGEAHRFYLRGAGRNGLGALTAQKPARDSSVLQTVNLTNRSDLDRFAPTGPLIDQALDDWPIVAPAPNIANSLVFVSAPLAQPPEVSGLFSGQLDFIANKKDLDIGVTLFELTAKGEYLQLSYVWQRASYARDRSHRQLLTPGVRTHMAFRAGRLTSRQLQSGSRLVAVVAVIKQPGEQINYGTGKNVSDETLADAGAPLTVRWLSDSYVDVPISGQAAMAKP